MRRDSSANFLASASASPPSSPRTLADRFSYYKKLNLVAFGSTLVYIGYLAGRAGTREAVEVDRARDATSDDNALRNRLRAGSNDARASASWDKIFEAKKAEGKPEEERPSSADVEVEEEEPITYAKGPVIHENKGRATAISLIGERHSGTNWITNHLQDCVSIPALR